MITCPHCQFENPGVHKFCQQCGKPLPAENRLADNTADAEADAHDDLSQVPSQVTSQVTSQVPGRQLRVCLMPPDRRLLVPNTYLNDAARRYRVVTVLSEGSALVADEMPEVRSPLQAKLAQISSTPSFAELKAVEDLPAAAYPYLLLLEASPIIYDVLQQGDTTLLVVFEEDAVSPLLVSLSAAVDLLQPVYWIYSLAELWRRLAPVPQWRSSLIQADNLGVDDSQSLRVRRFIEPSIQPSTLVDLKGFLQSLLAQPHQGIALPRPQIQRILQAITTAQTLETLSSNLAEIGEALLDEPSDAIASASEGSTSETPEVMLGVSSMTVSNNSATVGAAAVNNSSSEGVEEKAMGNSENNLEDELNNALSADGESASTDDATMLLPMRLSSLLEAGRTDVGKQRDHNEDCFLIASSLFKRADNQGQYTRAHGLYVLCDGMGGHDGGEVASSLAAKTLSDYFDEHWPAPSPSQANPPLPEKTVVMAAVKLANQAIYDVNEQEARAGHKRMGTTLVLVLLQGTEAVVAHIGDSRLYQYNRRMGLQQVTVDHEVGQREIQKGIPESLAYARPDAYQLTQALGPRDSEHLQPDVTYLRFVEDTLLLLCSDGLSDNDVVEDYLESHINPLLTDKKELSSGLNELVDLANEVNGHDNISAIALQIKVTPDVGRPVKPQEAGQTILQ